MEEEKLETDGGLETPHDLDEIRQRRLAYFQNTDATSGKTSEKLGASKHGPKSKIPDRKNHASETTLDKAGSRTAEFRISVSREEKPHRSNSRPEEHTTYFSPEKTPTVTASSHHVKGRRRRTSSCSSVSDDEVGPLWKPSKSTGKPLSSSSAPQFSKHHGSSQLGNNDYVHQPSKGERQYRTVRNSGDSEVENLFSNRKWVSDNEIPSLSLKESLDVDPVSVFHSKADFDDLGLSTHRPESVTKNSAEFADRKGARQRSISTESLTVGNMLASSKVDDIRSLLGEQKYRQFVEKSQRELNQLHHVVETNQSTSLNGNVRDPSRASRKDAAPMPPPQPPSQQIDRDAVNQNPSPRRRLRSSSPQQVSRTLQDIARNKEMREGGVSRNYEQVVVPHNVTFSTDEIYRQAYGGSARRGSTSSQGSTQFQDLHASQGSQFWNSLTPRQMAGMLSPSSPRGAPMFQAPFMPFSTGAMMYPPPTPSQPVYAQSPPGTYFYPQGAGGGGHFVPFSPKQHMFVGNMSVPPPGTQPQSPDPYLYHQHHPHSHSIPPPGYSYTPNGPAPQNSAGMSWQYGPVMHGMQDAQGFVQPPHPPSNVDPRGGGQRVEGRASTEHADAVRQHHEQRRQQQEKQQPQPNNSSASKSAQPDFSTSSINRYFASIGMPLPPNFPPPSYNTHQPPLNQPPPSQHQPPNAQNQHQHQQHQHQQHQHQPHQHHHHHPRQQESGNSQPQRSHSSPKQASAESIQSDNDYDDNLTTVTRTSMQSGTSVRAGGITDRMELLGLDPHVLQTLKHSPDRAAADEEALDALRNLVRICPECSAVNKEYMTWCLQCGGVLIGIDPIPIKDLKKKKKLEREGGERGAGDSVVSSRGHSRTRSTEDSAQFSFSKGKKSTSKSKSRSSAKEDGKEKFQASSASQNYDADEPVLEYSEDRFEETIYDEDGVPQSCKKDLIITSPVTHAGMKEDRVWDAEVESPESGRGASSSSSPARRNIGREASEVIEDFAHIEELSQIDELTQVEELAQNAVETKDSGRPSSSEEQRKQPHFHSQLIPDDGPKRSEREINDICEVISDPIIRGFIKNYLQKKPGDQSGKASSARDAQSGAFAQQDAVAQNFSSSPFSLDLGTSFNSTVVKSGKNSDRPKGGKPTKKKKPVKKGHEAIDVEIFGLEEAKISRTARSGLNVVPKLNLRTSSDEDDDSEEKTSGPDLAQDDSSDASSTTENYAPVNYDKELQSLASQLYAQEEERKRQRAEEENQRVREEEEKRRKREEEVKRKEEQKKREQELKSQKAREQNVNVGASQSSSSVDQQNRNQQAVDNNFSFLKELVDNPRPSSSSSAARKSTDQRSQGQGRPSPVSKVRASIEASPPSRHWNRSSTAWSSYNPRELRTRSSVNISQSGGSGRMSQQGQGRASSSQDNLAEPTASSASLSVGGGASGQVGLDKRQRPASADQHNRRGVNRNRPSSAGKGGNNRPFSAGHLSIHQRTLDHHSASSGSGDHIAGNRARNDSESDDLVQSPRPTDNDGKPIHRLFVQEDTLPLIPSGPSAAMRIYDRVTQTPRDELSQESKWLMLPDEMWLHVFTFLVQKDLYSAGLTCKQLHNISLDTQLWKNVTVQDKDMKDDWLTEIARRHPVSLAMVHCSWENLSVGALKELFKEVAPKLKELNFSRCVKGKLIGDEILLHASTYCRHLTHVDASYSHVTDKGLSALSGCCHRLESLCLNGCSRIGDDSLKTVVEKHGTSLRVLELFACFNLSPAIYRYIAEHCTFLLSLSIGESHKISDSTMVTLSASLSRVETLDLRGCRQLGDNCVRKIVRNCRRLRHLVLANCPFMTNSAIVEIATYSKDIRSLDVCGCSQINDSSIKELVANCNRLASIDISSTGCTHRSVLNLAEYCNYLECAKFNFLPDVREQSLSKLVRNCKRLHTLQLFGCSVRNADNLKRYNRFINICV